MSKKSFDAMAARLDFQIEAERLLGMSQWHLLSNYGKLMSGQRAGSYVSGIPYEEALAIIRALVAGEQVDVHLMHRHKSGNNEASALRFSEGKLLMVFSNRTEVGFGPRTIPPPGAGMCEPGEPVTWQGFIATDPAVMDGVAVFVGTRVPIDTVLASLDAGAEFARLVASWPFLTLQHVDAARAYREARPSKATRRRLGEVETGTHRVRSTVIRRVKPK